MTNFATRFEGKWKDGQLPKTEGNVVVSYDQSNYSYTVKPSEMNDFVEWVAQNWECDTCPRDFNEHGYFESAADYLDRADITIRKYA